MYKLECEEESLCNDNFWKLKAQPRFLVMLWWATNDMLPTNDWLRRLRLRGDAICPWGYMEAETLQHIFGSCKFMNAICREFYRLGVALDSSTHYNLIDLIESEARKSIKSPKAHMLLSILYNIWKARNNKIRGSNSSILPHWLSMLSVMHHMGTRRTIVTTNKLAGPPTPWMDQNKLW